MLEKETKPPSNTKYHIFLAKVFGIRIDLKHLKPENHKFLLITSSEVQTRLSAELKNTFSSICVSNFTQPDLEKSVRSLVEKHNIDIRDLTIVTNDEYALLPAASLRERFGIKGPQVKEVEPFINKIKMKQQVSEEGIRIPKYLLFVPEEYAKNKEEYIKHIGETLQTQHIFAKPIDSAGSQGIAELKTPEDLSSWCEDHKDATNYELDEFLDGDLYHVDSLIREGEIIDVQVFLNAYPNADFLKGKVFGSRIVTADEKEHASLVKFNEAVINSFSNPPNGATHHEIFRTRDDELVFLEIAARPSGGLVPQVHEKHVGRNCEVAHYLLQMNLPIPKAIPVGNRAVLAAWAWYPSTEGQVTSLKKNIPIKSDHKLEYLAKPGDNLHQAKTLVDRIATLFMLSEDKEQLIQDFEMAKTLRPVVVYPKQAVMKKLSDNAEKNQENIAVTIQHF